MKRSLIQTLVAGGVLVGLVGCGGWDTESKYAQRILTSSTTTGTDGTVKVRLPLPSDFATSKVLFRFTNVEEGQTVFVDSVESDDGTVLRRLFSDVDVNEMPTGAVSAQRDNHFNWPIQDGDADIGSGKLLVTIGAVTATGATLSSGSEIDITALLNNDPDFSSGDLQVYLHWTAGMEEDAALKADVDAAVERMIDIYAAAGITVTVTHRTQADDPLLAEGVWSRPGFGSPEGWLALSESTDDLAIDIVLVDEIAGVDGAVLGAAGSIPGGILPSNRSGVILSTTANSGPDLVFSADEIDLFGTTMAHEVGHMLGLFHPVELDFARWDALSDTVKCQAAPGCQGQLGDNLMYPTALCDSTTCLAQDVLTPGQISVMQRYGGVR